MSNTPPPPAGPDDVPPAGSVPPPAGPPSYGTPPGSGYAPPPAGGYPPPGYGAPQGGPVTPDQANTLTLNYWLSVFFGWIPALIFFLTQRGQNPLVDAQNAAILNFSLTRIIPSLILIIPIIGWIVGGIGYVVYFVFAIIGAVKGPDENRAGRVYNFPWSIKFIK